MHRLLIAFIALFLPAVSSAAPVLLISIDGLRPIEWTRAEAEGAKLPNLRALKDGGAWGSVTGVLPTVTYPSHATLLTGVTPARHGIFSNLTFDPLRKNRDGWYFYASDIRVPTLWDAAHAAGLKVANVHWPVSVAATGVDLNLPQIWMAGTPDDRKLVAALSTPGLVARLEQSLGPYADGIDESLAGDETRAKFVEAILRDDKPGFMTAYFTAFDHEQHGAGPDSAAARAVLERIDALVGRVVAAARAAQPDIVVAIVSDHGFAPVTRETNLFAPFIKAGLITLSPDGKTVTAWRAMPWLSGGSAQVILADPNDTKTRADVAALLAGLKSDPNAGVARIIAQPDIARMGGNPDAAFFIDLAPGFTTGRDPAAAQGAASATRGMHGYFPDAPAMRSTLILNGPAIAKRGDLGPVDMRAIAPTLARIMGTTLPKAEAKPLF